MSICATTTVKGKPCRRPAGWRADQSLLDDCYWHAIARARADGFRTISNIIRGRTVEVTP